MKKTALFLSLVLMLLTGASGRLLPPAPVPIYGVTCSGLYERFASSLDSGEIVRTEIGFETLLDLAGFTREEITFANTDDDTQRLTCRERQPLVFWASSEADYYDGTNYYYSYNGDWFIDRRNYYTSHLRQDFFGIPTEVLESFPVVRDEVFYQSDKFRGYMTMRAPDGNEWWELTTDITLDGVFDQVWITLYAIDPQDPEAPAIPKRHYHIRYDEVNEPLTITPPQSLDLEKVEGRKQA